MRRHLTGYIASCAISRVRSILQVSAPGPKTTRTTFDCRKRPRSAQRVRINVVLLKFHTPFLLPANSLVTKRIAPALEPPQYLARNPIRNIHLSLHAFKRLGAPNLFSHWRALVRVIGSLDTFDLFDSVGPDAQETS